MTAARRRLTLKLTMPAYSITVRDKILERLDAAWLLTFGFRKWIRPNEKAELADQIEAGIDQCWISGSDPSSETTVFRVTKDDARRIVLALRK